MAKQPRIAKTIEQKVRDLDAHLYLLRDNLHNLPNNVSHLKVVAAELRTLLCLSGGTEGLLWRLTEELNVDDHVDIHLLGNLIQDHPLARGLEFFVVPIQRAGKGDPRIKPGKYSLRRVIKGSEALTAAGKRVTHEYLIKAVAQQMGTAHEDDGLEPALARLSAIFVNGVMPFVCVLAMDAELTLEIGEKVLEVAESQALLVRATHNQNYGNLSIAVRLQRTQHLLGRIEVFRFQSHISSVTIRGFVAPTGIVFEAVDRDSTVTEFTAPFPSDMKMDDDVVGVFSYCSSTRQVRTLTAAGAGSPVRCNLGWIHAAELHLEEVCPDIKDMFKQRFLLSYDRLLSSRDVAEMANLPSSGYGLWKFNDELQAQGPFPE
jgi:hypothetical protein